MKVSSLNFLLAIFVVFWMNDTAFSESLEKCRNTEYDARDLYGNDCSQYEKYGIKCGIHDNEDFESNKMCCVCGGGMIGSCISTDGNSTDKDGFICDSYQIDDCGNYDGENFVSINMCCVCGGGKFACNSSRECLDNEYCINGFCTEEFVKMEKSICSGNVMTAHSSLSAAKDDCKKDENCNVIFDAACDNYLFWTCQGKVDSRSTSPIKTKASCVWEKTLIQDNDQVSTKNPGSDHILNETEQIVTSPENMYLLRDQSGDLFVLMQKNCILMVITLVLLSSSFLWLLQRKEARTQENLMRHIQNTFMVICIVLACYMIIKESLRYSKNEDLSNISYKNFGSSSKNAYPSFSFCLVDDSDDEALNGLIYSYFKDEIALTLPTEYPYYSDFFHIMTGKSFNSKASYASKFNIQNISEDYANAFEVKLERIYAAVNFVAEHPNDSIGLSVDGDFKEDLPFYVSYQDPDHVCFTRNDDKREEIIRLRDMFWLDKQELKKFDTMVAIKFFIHHPGQLLRGFNTPIVHAYLRDIDSTNPEIAGTDWATSEWIFKISQVSILRKRADARSPCNPDLQDDDLEFRKQVCEEIGCIPHYWNKLKSIPLNYGLCKTPDEMKKIWEILNNRSKLNQVRSKYLPPCDEMKLSATYHTSYDSVLDSVFAEFYYMDKSYEMIVNEREFSLESLWSAIGGFVGIFVGTSLSQAPSLIASSWNWMRNRMK